MQWKIKIRNNKPSYYQVHLQLLLLSAAAPAAEKKNKESKNKAAS